jgi:hypothetical protein
MNQPFSTMPLSLIILSTTQVDVNSLPDYGGIKNGEIIHSPSFFYLFGFVYQKLKTRATP